jgi:DNA-binding PadR family transcriptional regulator
VWHGGPRRQQDRTDERLLRILAQEPCCGHRLVKRLLAEQPAPPAHAARSMYLGLHRLERMGLLTSDWRPVPGRSIQGKRYRVTVAGARRLGLTDAAHLSARDFDPVTLLVVIAVIGSGGTFEARGQNRRPHLTIFVDRRVPVSPDELRRASLDVNRILGAIGVTADWEFEQSFEQLAPRRASGAPTGFVVHVVIIARVSGLSRVEALPLGLTPPGPHFGGADVVVFHDHVQEFAQVRHKPAASVLALVITHEIGHALLPAPAHSSVGIMQAEWDQQTMDQADDHELRFTTQQGALIREQVNHCCGLTAGR